MERLVVAVPGIILYPCFLSQPPSVSFTDQYSFRPTAVVAGNELVKFAGDTYIVVPASNIHTRQAEIDRVEEWTRTNNLKVNPSKYAEIEFRDKRRKITVQPPPALPDIKQVNVIKILGITFTNNLSAAEYVHDVMIVITSCAQTLCTL